MKSKISGWIIGILAILVVAGIFYIGYERGQQKEMKKALDALEVKTIEEISIKDEEIEKRNDQIKELEKALVRVNERLDILDEEKAKWKEEAEKWKEKASEATPETLIVDIREILETNEVWLVEDGVLFSVDAFRKVIEKLYDWRDFTLVREPNYKQTIETYKTKVYLLTDSNRLLKEQVKSLGDIRALQQTWNEEMKQYIVKSSGSNFWSTVQKVGTGIAIGAFGIAILGD